MGYGDLSAGRAPGRATISFVDDLAVHGSRPALLTDDEVISYGRLAERVAAAASALGPRRRLVLIEAANTVGAVVAELAALAGGHAAVLATPGSALVDEVVERFDPDVVVGPDGSPTVRRAGSRHDLHPELALLLSTSGTTGSPKLVRLSATNLDSNARAIARYLRLAADDCAITTLPLAYCYGLSVLHSHLLAGAGVVLQSSSVVDPCFWARVRSHGVTSLAGVPHTFELLDRVGFADLDVPTLRRVTQAGGRWDPEAVRRYAALGRQRGWELFVMYGQTEATARMAYLPPHLAEQRPASIGRPIPGGRFELRPVDGAPPGVGELVYVGPNVMLGYAEAPGDLGLGRTTDELVTGDLARMDEDGLVEICGRANRVVKPFGLRIDLDRVEAMAGAPGRPVLVAGDDRGLVVATSDAVGRADLGANLSATLGLPRAAVVAVDVDELPRSASGKPDYAAVLALGRPAGDAHPDEPVARPEGAGGHPVDELFRRVLGVAELDDHDTFVGLGGDSLSYVEVSIGLERILGRAPDGWHLLPLRDLRAVEPTSGARRTDTTVVLRAVGIVGVVLAHAGLLSTTGAAHVLLAVAGFNVARFTVAGDLAGRTRRGLRQLARLALPTAAYVALLALVVEGIHPSTIALASGYVGEGTWRFRYWFVEVLVALLVLVVAMGAIPGVAGFERRRPMVVAGGLFAAALAVRGLEVGPEGWDEVKVHGAAWVFFLGWLAARADGRTARVVLSVVAAWATVGAFDRPGRDLTVAVGVLALIWWRDLPVPQSLHRVVGLLAGASLVIYLTHWQVLELLGPALPAPVVAAVAVAGGTGAWAVGRSVLAGRRGPGAGLGPVASTPVDGRELAAAR